MLLFILQEVLVGLNRRTSHQCDALLAERKEGGVGDLKYPLVSDLKREIATKYSVLNADGVALRGLFIVDKEVSKLQVARL